jgi:molecular chaperone GrpE
MASDPRQAPENLAAEQLESPEGTSVPPAASDGAGNGAVPDPAEEAGPEAASPQPVPAPPAPGPEVSGPGPQATASGPGASEPGPQASASEAEPVPEEEVDPELARLREQAARAEEYLALAQRTRADFENYRRRAMRDAALAQERGVVKLARELLAAVDNLDRALGAADAHPAEENGAESDVDAQLRSGIRLVHADVLSAFARVGIEPFSPVGEAFDPQLHEAVAHQPVEGASSGTVVEVYQPGYRLGEGVLRPARVLVAA